MVHEWVVRSGLRQGRALGVPAHRPGGEDRHHRGRRSRHARPARRPAPRARSTTTTGTSSPWPRARSSASRSPGPTRGSRCPPPSTATAQIEHSQEVFSTWAETAPTRGPTGRRSCARSSCCACSPTAPGAASSPRRRRASPRRSAASRNWDYRYCWLRDASLTLGALLRSGHVESTRLWRDWLIRAVAGDPEDLQIMYAVDGGRELPERELGHLPGYAGSRPVRVGNGAVDQQQADVLGEVMIALAEARAHGLDESAESWEVQRSSSTISRRRGTSPTTGCGRSAARRTTSPSPRHGVGGLRPGGPGRRGARPRRPGRAVARAARHRARGRSSSAATTPSATPSPSTTTTTRGRRGAAHDPARRLPPRRRPAGARDDPGHRGGPHAGRPRPALPHLGGRRRPRGDEHPFLACCVVARRAPTPWPAGSRSQP